MPIADDVRGVAMARRVEATARSVGVSAEGRWLLGHALRLALSRRGALLDDDHDPHYLHAGRSALILLLDTGELNPVLLAAAALAESERAELRVPDDEVWEGCPPSFLDRVETVLALRRELPSGAPEGESPEVLERLLGAGEAVRRVALAERLDHVRHVHMWSGPSRVRELLGEVDALWLPVAERTHERLARRFRHWARATRRKSPP